MRHGLLLLLVTACASGGPRQFKARYSHEGDNAPEAPQCAGFAKVDVRDARKDPKIVGERVKSEGQEPAPITLTNDSATWAKEGIESQARTSQFLLGNPNHPTLDVSVNTLDIQEKVFQNGSYNARVVIDVTVTSPNGQRCLNASFEGTGKNYGSAGDSTNYTQTINRALDNATAKLFANAALRDAACKCMPGG